MKNDSSMLGYYDDNLFGTFHNRIFYCNLSKHINNLDGSNELDEEQGWDG